MTLSIHYDSANRNGYMSTIANGIRNHSQECKVPMVEGIKASSKKVEMACVYG